jgi:serine/threonine protein kinase
MVSPLASVLTTYGGERYRLLACIGRGVTGGVYRACSEGEGLFVRDVCIKRMSGSMTPEAERAMREEARLLARVRHANVVSLLAMGHEDEGAPFLVLELIDGADLRALTKFLGRRAATDEDPTAVTAGWLPDRVAVHVACGILRALAAVQRAIPGLVHRDVTPHNVLVSREGEVKLTDFGIALALDRARWTRPSVVKGKVGYMAPEQIRGETLDVRCDLFAVGVVLFELLTRRRPWFTANASRGDFDELRAIEQGEIASIVECRRIDRVLGGAVDRLLAFDREDRFESADAAMRALAPFSAGEVGSLRLASIVEDSVPRPYVLPSSRAVLPPDSVRPSTLSLGADAPLSPEAGPDGGEASRGECDPAAHGPSSEDADLTVIEGRSRRVGRGRG